MKGENDPTTFLLLRSKKVDQLDMLEIGKICVLHQIKLSIFIKRSKKKA